MIEDFYLSGALVWFSNQYDFIYQLCNVNHHSLEWTQNKEEQQQQQQKQQKQQQQQKQQNKVRIQKYQRTETNIGKATIFQRKSSVLYSHNKKYLGKSGIPERNNDISTLKSKINHQIFFPFTLSLIGFELSISSIIRTIIISMVIFSNISVVAFSPMTTPVRNQCNRIRFDRQKYGYPKRNQFSSNPFKQQQQQQQPSVLQSMTNENNSNFDDGSDDNNKDFFTFEEKKKQLDESSRLSLAPMMEYTDRHFRHLFRLISKNTLLYTEMVAANAIAHEYKALKEYTASYSDDDYDDWQMRRYLSQSVLERSTRKSVLQLGGSDPAQLYTSGKVMMEMTNPSLHTTMTSSPKLVNDLERFGCDYTAINLNCGCPSPKVAGKGCFGAALMDDPILVRDCCSAMFDATERTTPITVKCRIGTDLHWSKENDADSTIMTISDYRTRENKSFEEKEYHDLANFIDTISSGGVVTDFQIHARIAVLKTKSFSPSDNRKIPPLKYDFVHRLVQDFPHLTFSLNGGIETLSQVKYHLDNHPNLQGIMVGRGIASNPWGFAMADALIYNDNDIISKTNYNRWELLKAYGLHADSEEAIWGTKIRRFIIKAVQSLFTGEPNAKRFRIELDRVAGLPKLLEKQGLSPDSDPVPLSEYILNAAKMHLSEETLLRSPEESYEHLLEIEKKSEIKQLS